MKKNCVKICWDISKTPKIASYKERDITSYQFASFAKLRAVCLNYCSEFSNNKTTDIIVKGLILGLSKFFKINFNFFPINFLSEKKTGKIWWEISKPQNRFS